MFQDKIDGFLGKVRKGNLVISIFIFYFLQFTRKVQFPSFLPSSLLWTFKLNGKSIPKTSSLYYSSSFLGPLLDSFVPQSFLPLDALFFEPLPFHSSKYTGERWLKIVIFRNESCIPLSSSFSPYPSSHVTFTFSSSSSTTEINVLRLGNNGKKVWSRDGVRMKY